MLCIFFGTSARNQALPSRCSRKVIGESCTQEKRTRLANTTRWHKIFPFIIPVKTTRRGILRRSTDVHSLLLARTDVRSWRYRRYFANQPTSLSAFQQHSPEIRLELRTV